MNNSQRYEKLKRSIVINRAYDNELKDLFMEVMIERCSSLSHELVIRMIREEFLSLLIARSGECRFKWEDTYTFLKDYVLPILDSSVNEGGQHLE